MEIAVCILAHNEERYIERTIRAVLDTGKKDFSITVYANGCTDRTHEVVVEFSKKNPLVKSIEIKIPSKVNAWNTAFHEQTSEYIVFCDGDVVPEKEAVHKLIADLKAKEERIIVSTRLFPYIKDAGFERSFVGFMQLPLKHEFLSGGMYAVKREKLLAKLKGRELSGIPMGIIGEDYFLERLIEPSEFYISKCKNYYEPPTIKDYVRYLARIRWQNEQMKMVLGNHRDLEISKAQLVVRKFTGHKNGFYLLISLPAVITKNIFKKIYSGKISEAYKRLGPVVKDGDQVLTKMTRSHSTK